MQRLSCIFLQDEQSHCVSLDVFWFLPLTALTLSRNTMFGNWHGGDGFIDTEIQWREAISAIAGQNCDNERKNDSCKYLKAKTRGWSHSKNLNYDTDYIVLLWHCLDIFHPVPLIGNIKYHQSALVGWKVSFLLDLLNKLILVI